MTYHLGKSPPFNIAVLGINFITHEKWGTHTIITVMNKNLHFTQQKKKCRGIRAFASQTTMQFCLPWDAKLTTALIFQDITWSKLKDPSREWVIWCHRRPRTELGKWGFESWPDHFTDAGLEWVTFLLGTSFYSPRKWGWVTMVIYFFFFGALWRLNKKVPIKSGTWQTVNVYLFIVYLFIYLVSSSSNWSNCCRGDDLVVTLWNGRDPQIYKVSKYIPSIFRFCGLVHQSWKIHIRQKLGRRKLQENV